MEQNSQLTGHSFNCNYKRSDMFKRTAQQLTGKLQCTLIKCNTQG